MGELDQLWILVATALVLLMQGGFLLLEAGMTRAKNYINVAVKNLADLGMAVLLFWLVGYGLMFGSSAGGLFGFSNFAMDLPLVAPDVSTFFLFQVVFAGTTVTIISGAIAERTSFNGYMAIVLTMAVAYPVYGHWVWGGGWLAGLGFVDFAGSTVVHSIGGWAALAAMLIIGPRFGRFDEHGNPTPIRPSNLPLAMTGCVLLWFGWIGFNGGSTLAFDATVPGVIAITMMGGAAGLVTAMFAVWVTEGYPVPAAPLNGALAGLVAVTAGAHALNTWSALLIGAVGALVGLRVESLLERFGVDDAVGAVPIHLGAGAWGTVAVGIFGRADVLGTDLSRPAQVGIQVLGVAVAGLWGFGVPYVVFRLVDKRVALRVPLDHEIEGLNVAEHREPTALIDLLHHMEFQTRTGEIGDPIEAESFTEVGQIAEQFNGLTTHLRSMSSVAEQIASGNLSVDVMPRSDRDTFGLAFQRMIQDLRTTFGGISSTADDLGRSVNRLGSLTDDIDAGVSVQRQGIERGEEAFEQVRGLIDQLVGEVHELGGRTSSALDHLVESMDSTRGFGGADLVSSNESEDLRSAVAAIDASAEEITSIIDVVRAIADTTNLLALNANIEAARAGGAAGDAFAVVADEVRELATKTVQSVQMIERQISTLQSNAGSAVGIVEGVVSKVEDLNSTFEHLTAGVNGAAEELQGRAERAQSAIETISEVSNRNAETSAEFRQLAKSVESGVVGVGDQLSRFRT
jgi:ammonium transporter